MSELENYFRIQPTSGTNNATVTVSTLIDLSGDGPNPTGRNPIQGTIEVNPDADSGQRGVICNVSQQPGLFNRVYYEPLETVPEYPVSTLTSNTSINASSTSVTIYYASNINPVFFTIEDRNGDIIGDTASWKPLPTLTTGTAGSAIAIRTGVTTGTVTGDESTIRGDGTAVSYQYTPSPGTISIVGTNIYKHEISSSIAGVGNPGTVEPYYYKLTINVPQNTQNLQRHFSVYSSDTSGSRPGCSSRIVIHQNQAGEFSIDKTSLEFGPTTTSQTFNIDCGGTDINWNINLNGVV